MVCLQTFVVMFVGGHSLQTRLSEDLRALEVSRDFLVGCWNFLASPSLKTRKPTCIFCIQKHNIRYPLQSILARGSYLRSQRTGPIFLIYSNMGNCSQCLSRGKEVWLTSLIGLAVSKRQVILFSAIMYANFHF